MAMRGTNAHRLAQEFIHDGVYIWHDLFRANEIESKTSLVRLLGVKQTKNKIEEIN
jgi:hypothetical protein